MANLEELKAEFEELTSGTLPDLEDLKAEFKALTGTFSGLKENLGGLKSVGKEMSKSKFGKATKSLKNTFKSMIGAAASGDKIGLVMAALKPLISVLEPLADLFKPFTLILDLVSILISAMVSAALVPMYEALQPVYDAIIALVPTFIELGTLLGGIIASVITHLVGLFVLLVPPIVAFLVELMKTEGFIILVQVAIGILGGVIAYLIYPLGILIGLIIVITTVFNVLADIFNNIVMPAIRNFIMGIAIMIDAITLGMAGAVNFVKGIMEDLPTSTDSTSTLTSPTSMDLEATEQAIEEMTSPGGGTQMQEGGITLSEGLYHLHDREIVAPLDPFTREQNAQKALLGEILNELLNQSSIQRKTYLDKEFKYMFERT